MLVSTKQQRIAELAIRYPDRSFCSLHHHIDYAWLVRAYGLIRKEGAAGVDEVTAALYEENFQDNIENLLCRVKSGQYVAPPIKRVYIPKGQGELRPIGIPTLEDKIVQRAVVMLLEPIYEQDFSNASFGFRRGRSAHQALQHLRNHIMENRARWVLDVDIQKYFDTIDHQHLRSFLDRRVTDGIVRKLINKWLKAGILERGQLRHPAEGTPQGGVISPLLANIYLHYVLDDWFSTEVAPRMRGRCSLTRFADDFVMIFEDYKDCHRVQKVLGKRFERFGLRLHPEKTRRVDFRFKYRENNRRRGKAVNFDFLGFTHYWGTSRRGKPVVYQKTAKSRLAKAIKAISTYCRLHRHDAIGSQQRKINQMLRGHFAYFGITGNGKSLNILHHKICEIWRKWLSRRSRKSAITWSKFSRVLERFPLVRPKIHHQFFASYQAAKQSM